MEPKKLTYKEAVSEIEEILEKLENDELDIDELAVKVKRVSVLLRYCKEKLTTTDKEIQSVIDNLEKPENPS
jgi:exodeoxyribonuclease VII small subunit